MKWLQVDWRTYISADAQFAVALQFNERDWFICTRLGGDVEGKPFSSAEEAMRYVERNLT